MDVHLQGSRPGFTLDVALSLPEQGVTALFGPSGCGKTTLLRAVAGLERARGRVSVGQDVWQDDATQRFVPTHQRALGYVIQESALFAHLSVQGNVLYGRRRVDPAQAEARISLEQVVALLGIGGLMDRRPATLSGGERQRVAIARALAPGPMCLLMDEPLAALDAERKAEILPYLERLHQELALPILYVTHAMDEVARLADHLVVLEAGRVRAAGALSDLLARPDLPLGRFEDAGVVLHAQVQAHDPAYGLTHIAFPGGSLWLGASTGASIGAAVRARVLARDISVARQMPRETSILNVLKVRLEALQVERNTVLLRLQTEDDTSATSSSDGARLLARITRKSADELKLAVGDQLYAQVKGVALM